MDYESVKAYSSVIADAAEDSQPDVPVEYTAIDSNSYMTDNRAKHPPKWLLLNILILLGYLSSSKLIILFLSPVVLI